MTITVNTAPFLLLTAFTSDPNCGNPAAVVFLPASCLPCPNATYPTETLQAIAKNLNQPVTAFISPLSESDVAGDIKADFAIRWFTTDVEIALCGHGLLAAAKAIFAAPDLAGLIDRKATHSKAHSESGEAGKYIDGPEGTLRFMTITGSIVSARKQVILFCGADTECMEVTLPHAPPTPILPASPAANKVRAALSKALQKPAEDVDVKFMGEGEGMFNYYLLVELGEGEKLEGRSVVTDAFKETGYKVNILTSTCSPTSSKEVFVSRMFAPLAGVPEDHVCGSAHCLLTPYWAQKRASSPSSVSVETPMQARQVSSRGGLLLVSWTPAADERKVGGFVSISGEVTMWGRGEVFI